MKNDTNRVRHRLATVVRLTREAAAITAEIGADAADVAALAVEAQRVADLFSATLSVRRAAIRAGESR